VDKSIPNGVVLDKLIESHSEFNNWVMPSQKAIEKEYNVEYKHHIIYSFGELWPILGDFESAIKNAQIVSLSEDDDKKVYNRSNTKNMESLVNLVSAYRSWPEFRNMDTLKDMVIRFKENKPMTMPIILKENKYFHLMSGNTKLDIAFMMNITPKALVIDINN
jgi:hypothetical protein